MKRRRPEDAGEDEEDDMIRKLNAHVFASYGKGGGGAGGMSPIRGPTPSQLLAQDLALSDAFDAPRPPHLAPLKKPRLDPTVLSTLAGVAPHQRPPHMLDMEPSSAASQDIHNESISEASVADGTRLLKRLADGFAADSDAMVPLTGRSLVTPDTSTRGRGGGRGKKEPATSVPEAPKFYASLRKRARLATERQKRELAEEWGLPPPMPGDSDNPCIFCDYGDGVYDNGPLGFKLFEEFHNEARITNHQRGARAATLQARRFFEEHIVPMFDAAGRVPPVFDPIGVEICLGTTRHSLEVTHYLEAQHRKWEDMAMDVEASYAEEGQSAAKEVIQLLGYIQSKRLELYNFKPSRSAYHMPVRGERDREVVAHLSMTHARHDAVEKGQISELRTTWMGTLLTREGRT